MRLSGKVAIITGGARGIGRASAELFAEEGARVVVADLSLDEPFADPRIDFVAHDVTDEQSWARLVDGVIAEHGRIDILFNNAGIVGSYEPVDSIALEDWRRVFDINVNGAFHGVRAVVPHMRRGGGGSIVTTSSIWASPGPPASPHTPPPRVRCACSARTSRSAM